MTVGNIVFGCQGSHRRTAEVQYRRNVNDHSQSSGWYSNNGATKYEAAVPTIMLRHLLIRFAKSQLY